MTHDDLFPWQSPQPSEPMTLKTVLAACLSILFVFALLFAGAVGVAVIVALVAFVLLACALGLALLLAAVVLFAVSSLPCLALRAAVRWLTRKQPKTD